MIVNWLMGGTIENRIQVLHGNLHTANLSDLPLVNLAPYYLNSIVAISRTLIIPEEYQLR
jgi:hypothetical protein